MSSFVSFNFKVNFGTIIGKFSESYFIPQYDTAANP